MLKRDGRFAVLYMAWLPFQDEIARASEELVLKFNPLWSGGGETEHPIEIPKVYTKYFETAVSETFPVDVLFNRESWNGRMRSCRGIGASLSAHEIEAFNNEHLRLLKKKAPPEFNVRHYAAISVLKVKK